METDTQRLLHTFAALADLGQEIADTGDFEEMLRASFHLLLGSLAIRRGGVAEYDRDGCCLRVIASRGLGETSELALPCSNEKATGETLTEGDLEIVGVLARHLGVGIHSHRLLEEVEHKADENRRLYDGLRTIYKETVHAFAAAIDIKDRYTQGHSVRVGKYRSEEHTSELQSR